MIMKMLLPKLKKRRRTRKKKISYIHFFGLDIRLEITFSFSYIILFDKAFRISVKNTWRYAIFV